MQLVKPLVSAAACAACVISVGVAAKIPTIVLGIIDALRQQRFVDELLQRPVAATVSDASILDPNLYIDRDKEWPTTDGFLLLVGRNQCTYCPEAMRRWSSPLDDVRRPILYVDANVSSMIGPVPINTSDQMPAWHIRDLGIFVARTGIRVIPMTFVFESISSVPCVISGIPEFPQREECLRRAAGSSTQFFANRSSIEPLQ